MAKFIMSVGDETLRVLTMEADKRNVRVQQLIRAVIVPEWVRNNLGNSAGEPIRREIDIQLTCPSVYGLQRDPCLSRALIE